MNKSLPYYFELRAGLRAVRHIRVIGQVGGLRPVIPALQDVDVRPGTQLRQNVHRATGVRQACGSRGTKVMEAEAVDACALAGLLPSMMIKVADATTTVVAAARVAAKPRLGVNSVILLPTVAITL